MGLQKCSGWFSIQSARILIWDRTSPMADCPAIAQDALGGATVEV